MKINRRQALLLVLVRHRIKKRKEVLEKKKRRFCVRIIFEEIKTKGDFHTLVADMKLFNHEYFQKQFRMSPTKLEELLRWVAPRIIKKSEKREPIAPEERLCVTLRYLVTGDARVTIGSSYRISPTSTGRIIKETTAVIWDVLYEQNYLKVPSTEQEWREIAKDFEGRWNFPHFLGAIDGKHINMQAPANSGSLYFNCKKTFSVV